MIFAKDVEASLKEFVASVVQSELNLYHVWTQYTKAENRFQNYQVVFSSSDKN